MNKSLIILGLVLILIALISGCIQTGEIIRDSGETNETQTVLNETQPALNETNETQSQLILNESEAEEDPCEGIVCEDSVETCRDGFNATCSNTCANGSCSSCTPDCSGHNPIHIDLCDGLDCPDSVTACPDGFEASCKNTCSYDTGCSSCTPDCSEHQIQETQDLCEGVSCESTVTACPDGFNATCPNTCNPETGSCSTCTPDCSEHQLCEEDWTCTEWSECTEEQQTRTCSDQNECGTEENMPEETRTCEIPEGSVFDIVINEVMPNPEEGPEWLELYNPTPYDIDLNGAWIDDILGGGKGKGKYPKQIENITIPSNGFFVLEITSYYFNNDNDTVNFIDVDGITIIDSYYYNSTEKGKSWYRLPNGEEWQSTPTENPTKGESN